MEIVDRVGQLLEIFLSERLVQFMFSNHLGLFTTLGLEFNTKFCLNQID